jgi:putative PIN family toxin of toxin-antitoxin system
VRAVFDTNVKLSGLLWHGTPHRLVEHIRAGALTMITLPALLGERTEVISRAKFRATLVRSGTDSVRMLTEVRLLAEIIDPPSLPTPVSRDPSDDAVLARAIAARAYLIISGDADLLVLDAHAGIRIVTPGRALAIVGG